MPKTIEEPWPYNLPIFRRSYTAASPDGRLEARIVQATEISMSNPTSGRLLVTGGLVFENCNPSFIWSNDSRYLVVPQFFQWLGIFRRQRLLLIDFDRKKIVRSKRSATYLQPRSFEGGVLVVERDPVKATTSEDWRLLDDAPAFVPFKYVWPSGT